eukprot:scaffold14.g1075.t1
MPPQKLPFFVAVHAGAGYHSPAKEATYSGALADTCRAAAAVLAGGGAPEAAVEVAIRLLEDCPACNAGHGSNLSMRGLVECDASLMAGDGAFGAVGAAPGVANPIAAAARLAAEGRQPLSHGRVRPMMLAGDRAREWALSRNLQAAASAEEAAATHVTPAAQRRWEQYRSILGGGRGKSRSSGAAERVPAAADRRPSNDAETRQQGQQGQQPQQRKRPRLAGGQQAEQRRQQGPGHRPPPTSCNGAEERQEPEKRLYDTVGCVAVDARGCVAAGVSSGGIALKTEGRVGEAAAFGAGCWAQDAAAGSDAGGQSAGRSSPAVAVSVSGVGERIMRHLLARECACRLVASAQEAAAAATADSGDAPASAGAEPAPTQAAAAAEQGQGSATAGEVAGELLQQTLLQGPPPCDGGILCLTVALEPAAAAVQRDGGARASTGGGSALRGQPHVLHVELGVAHCAQSMAVAYCSSSGSGRPRQGGRPAVAFLRRPGEGPGGADGSAVRTLAHGTSWAVPPKSLNAEAPLPESA